MSEDKAAVEKLHASYGRMKEELSQVIVGQHEVVVCRSIYLELDNNILP